MERICGIYCIENKINHKKYIGQSIDIKSRWQQHRTRAQRDNYNSFLYGAMKKYGIESFNFIIIEECAEEELDEREIFWIAYYDTFKRGYNMTTGGQSCTTRNADKMRNKLPNGFCLNGAEDVIKVAKLSLDFEILEVYESINECARRNGLEATNISKCCKQYHKTCGGFIYLRYEEIRFKSKDEIKQYIKYLQDSNGFSKEPPKYKRKVALLDDNNNVVKIYPTMGTAVRELDLDGSSLSKVCRGKLKSTNGYKFKYVN